MKALVTITATAEVRGPDGQVKETMPITFEQEMDLPDSLGTDTTVPQEEA